LGDKVADEDIAAMYRVLLIVLGFGSLNVAAQYDVGISAGSFLQVINEPVLQPVAAPWYVGLFYRERTALRTNIGMDVALVRAAYAGQWVDASRAGGYAADVDRLAVMYLQLSPLFDVAIGENLVFRFGPQIGWKLDERISATRRVWRIGEDERTERIEGLGSE
jgi:hypothetical protein